MKNRIFYFFSLLVLISNLSFADTNALGEIIFEFKTTYSGRFNLTASTSNYCWDWNIHTSSVYLVNGYNRDLPNLTSYYFDSPKSKDTDEDSVAWGLITFTIESIADNQGRGGFSFTFTIDLRDENWNSNQTYYPGSDTHFRIDQQNEKIYLSHNGTNNETEMYDNATYAIWNIWNVPEAYNPLQNNFKIPVVLYNRIEGQNFDFGNLVANGQTINSGNEVSYQFNTSKSVNVGTPEYAYQSQRNYNFKWDYTQTNISPNGGTNTYNTQMGFSINFSQEPKSITRNFRPVYPLTINLESAEGNSAIGGTGQFKDPTTTNNYDPISIPANGYVKNEAFDSLDESINGQLHQQYGIKADVSFPYNNRNYYWYSGDFSTSGTNFIISGPTTKTANYKGTQLSSQTDAIAGNGQRKIVKTSNGYLHQVYESLGKVWYERSTDNGTTWQIMNGGQPVSAGTAKQLSIDFWNVANGPVIAVAYQNYSTSSASIGLSIFKDGVLQSYPYGFGVYGVNPGDQDNFNCRPVVSINPDGKILVVWYVDGEIAPPAGTGLNYKYGYLYLYGGTTWLASWYTSSPVVMNNTTYFTLSRPTMSANKSSVTPFHIAYEYSNQIYYRKLTDDPNNINHIQEGSAINISSGSGFSHNNNPSIVANGTNAIIT